MFTPSPTRPFDTVSHATKVGVLVAVLYAVIAPTYEPVSLGISIGVWTLVITYVSVDPRFFKWAILSTVICLLGNFQTDLSQPQRGTWDHIRFSLELLASCMIGLVYGVGITCVVWPDASHDAVLLGLRYAASAASWTER